MVTSPNIPDPFDKREKSTIPKQIKNAESIIVFKKNQNVPRTTPDTFKPRVMGVTIKSNNATNFENHKSVPLFSTSQFHINALLVNSGKIKVISWINRYNPRPSKQPKSDSYTLCGQKRKNTTSAITKSKIKSQSAELVRLSNIIRD